MAQDLPALNALRAFESAARLGSVSEAARELHVTHGAVSRQVKQLEEQLGIGLFIKEGRGVKLTDAGVRLRDASPTSLPRVRFNYMSHEDDWLEFRACIAHTREIFAQSALAPYRGREMAPGESRTTQDDLDDFLRQIERINFAFILGERSNPNPIRIPFFSANFENFFRRLHFLGEIRLC